MRFIIFPELPLLSPQIMNLISSVHFSNIYGQERRSVRPKAISSKPDQFVNAHIYFQILEHLKSS